MLTQALGGLHAVLADRRLAIWIWWLSRLRLVHVDDQDLARLITLAAAISELVRPDRSAAVCTHDAAAVTVLAARFADRYRGVGANAAIAAVLVITAGTMWIFWWA